MLVVPFQLAGGTGVRWVTAAFLGLIALPLGYWGALVHGHGGGPSGSWPPAWSSASGCRGRGGLPPVHWSEWLAGEPVGGASGGRSLDGGARAT